MPQKRHCAGLGKDHLAPAFAAHARSMPYSLFMPNKEEANYSPFIAKLYWLPNSISTSTEV